MHLRLDVSHVGEEKRTDARNAELESIVCMPVLDVERPCNHFIDLFEVRLCLFGNVSHDGVDSFRLVVPLFALDDIFSRHSAF